MKKHHCPFCGAWNELSRFCTRCGRTIIFASAAEAKREINEAVAPSTQIRDMVLTIAGSLIIVLVIGILLS